MLARLKKILIHGDIPSREKQAVQKNIIEEENNKDLLYYEYARIRLDGQVTEFNTRKAEVRVSDRETDLEWSRSGEPERCEVPDCGLRQYHSALRRCGRNLLSDLQNR